MSTRLQLSAWRNTVSQNTVSQNKVSGRGFRVAAVLRHLVNQSDYAMEFGFCPLLPKEEESHP